MTTTMMIADELSVSRIIGRLMRALVITLLLTGALLTGILALINSPQWWRGFLAAALVSLLAAAASIPPLIRGLRHGMNQAVGGYFIATGIRAILSIGGCLLAILAGNYPATPTLLLMVPFYFALLAVESIFLARMCWSMNK